MPPKGRLLELCSREYICRSCLSALQKSKSPVAPRWRTTVRQSSSEAAPRQLTRNVQKIAEQDDDRRKTLEALGLVPGRNATPKVKVNYFDQGDKGKIRQLDDAESFSQAMSGGQADLNIGEFEDIGAGLEKLEEKLREAQELAGLIEEQGGKTDVDKLRREYFQYPSPEPITITVRPESAIQDQQLQSKVNNLNSNMRRLAKQFYKQKFLGVKQMRQLWQLYSSVRTKLRSHPNAVPTTTWSFLWDVFSAGGPENTSRMAHIRVLAQEMRQAGVLLSDSQQLLAIEAMFIDGYKAEAIENHRKFVTTLGVNPESFMSFWLLGLRMYCLTGDIERAERVMNRIQESPYEKDPRFVIPFIRACVEVPDMVEKGYDAYRDLRATLGDEMKIEDYDEIISFFLAVNQTEYALWIFVDMMTSGEIDLRGTNRHEHKLPSSIGNPFFVGKWLKRLIGGGNLAGAHNVVQYMMERGVVPRPIQVNGLVGAWLRSDTAKNVELADQVAWSMIKSRIRFAEFRRTTNELPGPYRLQSTGERWPQATLETFSLLAENYKTRSKSAEMKELWEALREAEITPDAFFLNQFLFSLIQGGQGNEVSKMCQTLTEEYGIKPDPSTFLALWQALPVNRQHVVSGRGSREAVAPANRLFAEMVGQQVVFEKEQGMGEDLAKKIIHTYRKLDDKVGMLVAYRALRHVFKLQTPAAMIFEILAGSSDIESLARSQKTKEKIVVVARQIEEFLKLKKEALEKSGQLASNGDLTPEQTSEELANFLEYNLEIAVGKQKDAEDLFRQAASEMGLTKKASDKPSDSRA